MIKKTVYKIFRLVTFFGGKNNITIINLIVVILVVIEMEKW